MDPGHHLLANLSLSCGVHDFESEPITGIKEA